MTTTTREAHPKTIWVFDDDDGGVPRSGYWIDEKSETPECAIEYTRADLALSTPATEPQWYVDGLLPVKMDGKMNDLGWKMIFWLNERGAKYDGRVFNFVKEFLASTIEEWVQHALAARPAPQPAADTRVVVKPLDLSNLLKHAFIAGRISAGAASSFHGHAWTEYDPTESAAYARILSAIIGTATPAQSDKIAEAARELELANDALCGARPQKIYDAMIAAGMADYMTRLDDARRGVRDTLRALAGQGETP